MGWMDDIFYFCLMAGIWGNSFIIVRFGGVERGRRIRSST